MRYSEALEHRIAIGRFLESSYGVRWLSVLAQEIKGRRPGDSSAAPQGIGALGSIMRFGEAFYVSEPICDLIEAVSGTIPSNYALKERSIPTQVGFVWFARPLKLSGEERPLCAFGWRQHFEVKPEELPDGEYSVVLQDVSGRNWELCLWSFIPVKAGSVPLPLTQVRWPRGLELGSMSADMKNSDDTGPSIDRRIEKMKYIAAFFAFIEQDILTSYKRPVERSVRRRIQRDIDPKIGHDPSVMIVTLRRKKVCEGSDEPKEIEWTCQWIVSGHWRQHWFPSLGKHQPIWISPHIKGPEDKPLKPPSKRLFAVVR